MLAHSWLILTLVAVGSDPKIDAAQAQAQACAEASITGDLNKLADFTHPKLIALIGGRTKLIEGLSKQREKLKIAGLSFVSVQAQVPTEVIAGGAGWYCVVPLTYRVKTVEGRMLLDQPMLGISNDDGKTWRYLDLTMTEPQVRKLFPEIPKTLKIPPDAEPRPDTAPEQP